MKKIVAFILSVLVMGIIAPITLVNAETASTLNEYAIDNIKILEDDKGNLLLSDNVTGEKVALSINNDDSASLKMNDGEIKEVSRDEVGNIYVDNKLEIPSPVGSVDSTIPSIQKRAASKWIYFQTTYYDTTTQGNLQSIALGLFSLMPYVGTVATIAGIIQTARNLNAPTLYVKVNQYHTKGYQFYKYDSFFYSNKARTKLVKRVTKEKRMW